MAGVDQEVMDRETVEAAAPTRSVEALKPQFTAALDVGFWEGLTKTPEEIIAARTPDQIITAFETTMPEYKPALDEIRNDPALMNSLHNVLVKDPTMLEGMTRMFAETGSMNPAEFAETLKEPRTRMALTTVFDKIAAEDDFTFNDFEEVYKSRNDQAKLLAKLKDMGIQPTSLMTGEDMAKVLGEYLNDPVGYAPKLAEMLDLSGAQGESFVKMMEYVGMYIELCIGGQDGYRSLVQKYGPSTYESAKNFANDISGETDRLAAEREVAGTGETLTPEQIAARAGRANSNRDFNTSAPIPQEDAGARERANRYAEQTAELSNRRDTGAPNLGMGN